MNKKLLVLLFFAFSLLGKAQDTCQKVKITDFPAKDLPPSSMKWENMLGDGSIAYYYGLDVPIDYVKARYLAFKEMETGKYESALGAESILIMLYANGYGVKRDLPLCIRLACANVDGAPAEIDGRIKHLKDMQSGKSAGVFDMCDDITSGMMEGICQSIYSQKYEQHRKTIIDSILKTWPRKDTAAYNKLRVAATSFFEARSGNEVDESGTGRAAFVLQESDSLESNFLDKIMKAGKCAFPNYTSADFIKADSELNVAYKKTELCN
jgi:hypothetical protein